VSPATAPSRHHVVGNVAKWVADNLLVKSAADCPLFDSEWRTEKILNGAVLFEFCGSGQSFPDFLEKYRTDNHLTKPTTSKSEIDYNSIT